MKKIGIYSFAVLMLGMGTLSTGCMGSWKLTSTVYKWNEKATGNKYVNNILFWLLSEVYGVTIFVDAVALNLIEFWTGSNPLAMKTNEKETEIVKGKDGINYQITVTQNQYAITPLDGANKGQTTVVSYNTKAQTWNLTKKNQTTVLARIYAKQNKAEVFTPNGSVQWVDLATAQNSMLLNSGM